MRRCLEYQEEQTRHYKKYWKNSMQCSFLNKCFRSDMIFWHEHFLSKETDFGLANFFVSKLLYWCQELPGQSEFSLQTSVWKENSDSVLVRVWWDLMYLELSGILQVWKQGSSLTSVKCTAKYVLFIIKM